MTNISSLSNPYRVFARQLAEDFLPDADLSKPAWTGIPRVSLLDNVTAEVPPVSAKTEASVLWTRAHLYLAFWCHYEELNTYQGEDPQKERWGLWDRDVAEVFVNPFPETIYRYWEFEVAPNNQWIDLEIVNRETIITNADWNSDFAHATSVDSSSKIWNCEMRIPARSMGVTQIQPAMEWRINFYRCDGLGDSTQRRFLAWSPTQKLNFHVPERFGWVRMES
jgi:hypothetical protein